MNVVRMHVRQKEQLNRRRTLLERPKIYSNRCTGQHLPTPRTHVVFQKTLSLAKQV